MVFCCFSCDDPMYAPKPQKDVTIRHSSILTSSGYPQSSPITYYRTGGNALSAKPTPSEVPLSSVDARQHDLIAATVPQGAWGGQIIRILHPDGSGREVEAQIPMGMTAGSTIYVKAGPSSTDSRPEKQPINDYSDVTPMPPPAKAGPPPFSQCLDEPNQSHPHMTSTPVAPLLEPSVNHSPFSNCLDSSDDQRESAYQSSYNSRTTNNGSKRLLKVTVPPNARPGTTIHIQAPGEDRLIAAQVPPDCSEFHVEYDEPSVGSRYTSSQQHFSSQSTPGHNNMHFRSNEKVLLVHVPPGVPAGSTLHVHIPNEPGRLLCAQVPPGNVRAFHVSYIAER